MIVQKLEWLSQSAQEAILYIGGDGNECAAFSHPCNLAVGDAINSPLLAISIHGVSVIGPSVSTAIHRQGETLAHDVIASVVDLKARIVSVGEIIIELDDPLPSDVKEEDTIQFGCGRLDVIS